MPDTTKTILVVDDNPDFILQLQLILEADGFRVVAARSQPEAEAAMEAERPDLAILDLMMEHMDSGFVLCHHIRKGYPGTPVIMVTAVTAETGLEFDAATDSERSCYKADAILDKPVRPDQLRREIKRLLKT
jgi:CheY-like chemotaxis protein